VVSEWCRGKEGVIECVWEAITRDSAAVFIAVSSHAGHTWEEIRIIDGLENWIVDVADSRTILKCRKALRFHL